MLYKLLRGSVSRYEDGERKIYDPVNNPAIELTPKQARNLVDYYGSRVEPYLDPAEGVASRQKQKDKEAEAEAKKKDPGSDSGIEELNVKDAANYIAKMESVEALANLIDDEEARDNRKGVLNVAYARLDDLEAEAAEDEAEDEEE